MESKFNICKDLTLKELKKSYFKSFDEIFNWFMDKDSKKLTVEELLDIPEQYLPAYSKDIADDIKEYYEHSIKFNHPGHPERNKRRAKT